jgi:mannose-1-phosphate guanylyltransferase
MTQANFYQTDYHGEQHADRHVDHGQGNAWALILAAGDGSRLRALTTKPCGTAVPKQFCSLNGGHTLLEDALVRAGSLVQHDHICTIVAQQHREFWTDQLANLPPRNVMVQPRNRGTAIGILYPLLHIACRDPQARILLLPADHYVRDEFSLRQSMRTALQRVQKNPQAPILLGIEPDHIDPDLGYILPGKRDELGSRTVSRFIEKPKPALAGEIIGSGGLWNAFIIAASVQTLIDLYMVRFAPLVMEMQVIVSRSLNSGAAGAGWSAIVDMYERFPTLDFSRDLLEHCAGALRVVKVPPCGWSDLGTPKRVAETLRRLNPVQQERRGVSLAHINLALQHALMESGAHATAGS